MSINAVLKIAGSGLNSQLIRMNAISSNLANASVVAGSAEEAYKAKRAVFSTQVLNPDQRNDIKNQTRNGVYVTDIVDDTRPIKQIFEPGNSLANQDGYIFGSNVNEIEEMVEMLDASRAYQNNVSVVSTAKDLLYRTKEDYEKSQIEANLTEEKLGQDAFLTLFTAQLQNQNPLDPMQNEAFVSQLAQFSQLESMESVDTSVKLMSDEMRSDRFVQGTNLLGTKISITGGTVGLNDNNLSKGQASLVEDYDLVTFTVENKNGDIVFEQSTNDAAVGQFNLAWNGLNNKGEREPNGVYKFSLQGAKGEERTELPVRTEQLIQSVGWNEARNEMQVEITDGRILSLSDLEKINI